MTQEIRIPRKIANQLLHLAQLSPTEEICGLVGGVAAMPTNCYPIRNTAEHPAQQFLMDASEQITAMRHMRDRQEDLFAIFHSHPSAPATPSTADLALAAYTQALYLIISLNTKGLLEMRGYQLQQDQFNEINLLLCED